METLEEAYPIAKGNGGAPGIDGQSFRDIESAGRAAFLAAVREDLVTGRYKPCGRSGTGDSEGQEAKFDYFNSMNADRVMQGALNSSSSSFDRRLLRELLWIYT